jgi:dTDP-4-amino-4,6-dideoxygalactose transaminase
MIKFNDFAAQYALLAREIDEAISRVLKSGWYILGKEVDAFEKEFAEYIGSKYCVTVGNGTEAIALSLLANDIGEGDEVITTNLTAFPTITGIFQSGAKPVVVDIKFEDGLIDTSKIEKKINKNTKAVVPVHLYGQSVNMDEIMKIAKRNNLLVIEDACQAVGTFYKDKRVGTFGVCGAFSFYPTKNLGALGDGGAIVTDSEELYEKLKMLRNYGQSSRYHHVFRKSINSRLDEIQAAILRTKLKYLDSFNSKRKRIADYYRANIRNENISIVNAKPLQKSNNHLFVIKHKKRDLLINYLKNKEVQVLIHYPIPINKQKAFPFQKDEVFINSEMFASQILSLPIYPELNIKDVEYIVDLLNKFDG